MKSIVFLVALSAIFGSASAGPKNLPDSIKADAIKYLDAKFRDDLSPLVDLIHPRSLAAFKEDLLWDLENMPLWSEPPIDSLKALSARQFYQAFWSRLNPVHHILIRVDAPINMRIIGVLSTETQQFVVYQYDWIRRPKKGTTTLVVVFEKYEGAWKIVE